jgi:hypothetical protein
MMRREACRSTREEHVSHAHSRVVRLRRTEDQDHSQDEVVIKLTLMRDARSVGSVRVSDLDLGRELAI